MAITRKKATTPSVPKFKANSKAIKSPKTAAARGGDGRTPALSDKEMLAAYKVRQPKGKPKAGPPLTIGKGLTNTQAKVKYIEPFHGFLPAHDPSAQKILKEWAKTHTKWVTPKKVPYGLAKNLPTNK